ncbi:MAG: hypothetical protein MUC49_07245 [Raineya sp.]|jgi:hypothetical protein|nr:hypothetical protein [Raineya sp.]
MKNYTPHKLYYFVASLTVLITVVGFFLYIDKNEQVATLQDMHKLDSARASYYNTETTSSTAPISPTTITDLNGSKTKISVITDWQVKGWKLNCAIEPLLNASERGKVVFKVKINENRRLVALEHLPNLSNLSEESVQSFKTTLELQLESCLERKNVKVESISSGTVTFFVNKF